MFDTLSWLFELLEICARYGLAGLVLIDSILIVVAEKRAIRHNITIFRGFLEFHRRFGFWKITCAKVLVSVLAGYPTVVFGRPALFMFYFIHVIVFGYRLFCKGDNYREAEPIELKNKTQR